MSPLDLPPSPPWFSDAACARVDPTLWTPPDHNERMADRRAREAAALSVCRSCPVIESCAEWGQTDTDGEPFNVYGGTTPEMRGHQKTRRGPAPQHGTYSGYRTHQRVGETPCVECKAAAKARADRDNARTRERRAEQRAQEKTA